MRLKSSSPNRFYRVIIESHYTKYGCCCCCIGSFKRCTKHIRSSSGHLLPIQYPPTHKARQQIHIKLCVHTWNRHTDIHTKISLSDTLARLCHWVKSRFSRFEADGNGHCERKLGNRTDSFIRATKWNRHATQPYRINSPPKHWTIESEREWQQKGNLWLILVGNGCFSVVR